MYKKIIEKLLSLPLKEQLQVNFDLRKKIFRLSIPIFSSNTFSCRVKEYVLARKSFKFKPHITSYEIDGENILLTQEIPFTLDFQSTTKKDIDQFLELSKHCKKMLTEIASEEALQDLQK